MGISQISPALGASVPLLVSQYSENKFLICINFSDVQKKKCKGDQSDGCYLKMTETVNYIPLK